MTNKRALAAAAAGGNGVSKSKSRRIVSGAASAKSEVAQDVALTSAGARIGRFVELLDVAGLSAFYIPTEDPHLCETPPECFRRREWLTGFSGSAGKALVAVAAKPPPSEGEGEGDGEGDGEVAVEGEECVEALLWTDGRYFLQAEQELSGTPWSLMRSGLKGVPEPAKWMTERLAEGSKVGVDPFTCTIAAARQMSGELAKAGCELVATEGANLVDEVWSSDRPLMPGGEVRVHPMEWAGKSVQDKLAEVRKEMAKHKAQGLVVCTLDEVAWLFNIRGCDVEHSPVAVAYAVVTADSASLFVEQGKVPAATLAHLTEAGVAVEGYAEVSRGIRKVCEAGGKVWMDPQLCSLGLFAVALEAGGAEGADLFSKGAGSGSVVERASPIAAAKARKNEVEIEGMVEAHARDGAALAEFLSWLEERVASRDGGDLTELDVSNVLRDFRSRQQGFLEPSFATIAGEGENGAVIHYRPMPGTSRAVTPESMLLLDSGGQYACGTTDVTRTLHFGEPTAHQVECFTRVLKGHIALAQAVFPENTPGALLDSFARSHLWKAGLDYRHGTGHGVGAALNVHEGPQGISPRLGNTTGLVKDMVVSNEPGYYEDGAFGIRIENLVVVVEASTPHAFGDKKYLCFRDLTMVPLDRKLMDVPMLSKEEVAWVDAYHQQVKEVVQGRLETDRARAWLEEHTKPLL